MSNIVALVYKAGGDFSSEHVHTLVKQAQAQQSVDAVICLTDRRDDVSIPGVQAVSFADADWSGWWAKMNLLEPGVFAEGERILYLDLDTRIVGDLGPLFNFDSPTLLSDFFRPHRPGSGVLGFDGGNAEWKETVLEWARWARLNHELPVGGDQQLLANVLGNDFFSRWQTDFPGKIQSYKADQLDRNPVGGDTRLVCWHGKPRPWEVGW